MLKIKNKNGEITPLANYNGLYIEEILNYGDKTLEFSIPIAIGWDIHQEDYILTRTDEFVIKQINTDQNGNFKVTAKINIDELEGTVFKQFESVEQTATECANLALAGTRWTCVCKANKRRTVRQTNSSSWEILKSIADTYRMDLSIDSVKKVVNFADKVGADKGAYFADRLNLVSLDIQSNTSEFYTRILPIGKDGLTIADVNNGIPYLENYQYSNKIKTKIWKDERYTAAESLKEDAEAKLSDIAQPYTSYAVNVIDLAKCGDYPALDYAIGDIVTIINKQTHTRIQQRIVKLRRYPDNPDQNTCEISNLKLTFDEYARKYKKTEETVNNITTDNGTVDGDAVDSIDAGKIQRLDDVIAANGMFEQVNTKILNITDTMSAINAKIGTLETTKLSASDADIKFAKINDFTAITGRVQTLETTALTSGSALIHDLTSDISKINTLMFGAASGGSLTTEFSNTVVGLIGDAQIMSAMIKDVAADKITSGKIYTNLVEVCSQSGNLYIRDNTLLIKDIAATPRVQLGKDATGDYNMYVWDQSGKLMFDALGLTADGINRSIIRNDMVSDNANISAKKLDITSLFTEINGSTETIKSSRIYVDADKQTLDVAFKTIRTETAAANTSAAQAMAAVNAVTETVTSQGTQLTAVQGQITSKVWQQDITTAVTPLKDTTTTLTNQYASLNQTLTGLTATVNSNTTQINTKADSGTVTAVQNTLTSLQADLNGFKTTASKTYTTKTEFTNLEFGGRSILTGTRDFTADCTINTASSLMTDKYNGLSVLCAQVPDTPYRDTCLWKSITIEPDTFYTLSFYGKAEIDGVQITSYLHPNAVVSGYSKQGNTTHSADGSIKTTLTSNWARYWIVWKTMSDITEAKTLTPARLMRDTNTAYIGKKIYLAGFKLEKGNKATDWTPAPEDVDAQIATVDSKFGDYATTAALNSAINQTASSITQSVSATYAAKSSLNNYATTQSVNASLALKIDRTDAGQIVSMINASADEINLTSNRLTIASDYYKMDRYGNTEFIAYDNNYANTKYNVDIGDGYAYLMQLNGIGIKFYTNGVYCGGITNSRNPYNPDSGAQINCEYIQFQRGGGISQMWFGQDLIEMEVAEGWTEKTINFGVTFKIVPRVFLQQTGGASSENMRVVNVTKTYFTVGLYSNSGSGFTNTFDWLAIG